MTQQINFTQREKCCSVSARLRARDARQTAGVGLQCITQESKSAMYYLSSTCIIRKVIVIEQCYSNNHSNKHPTRIREYSLLSPVLTNKGAAREGG